MVNMVTMFFAPITLLIWLAGLGMTVYSFYLFVQLATRGIKALDIYIEEKERSKID